MKLYAKESLNFSGGHIVIGGLWAELSSGRCHFAMVEETRWDWIDYLPQ